MSEEQNAGSQEPDTQPNQQQQGDNQESGTDQEKPKTVPLKEHIDLRNRAKAAEKERDELKRKFEESENAKLSEQERIQKEYEQLKKTNEELVVSQARTAAFMNAKAKIGEGFTLDGIEDKLFEKVGKLQYNPDTFETDVFELVDLAKRPKGSGRGVIRNNASLGHDKKASEYSTIELAKMEKEDPDRFKSVMDQRRANLSFNQKPHQRQ